MAMATGMVFHELLIIARKIQMLYFHNTYEETQKLPTYAEKAP